MSGPILLTRAHRSRNGLPVFLTTAERDLNIPAPMQGEACYVDDNTSAEGLQTFSGTGWRAVAWNTSWGEIAYGAAVANQLAITGLADITSATTTWAHPGNRKYRFTLHTPFASQNTSAATIILSITDGANTTIWSVTWKISSAQFQPIMIVNREIIGAAGSVTRKGRVSVSAGTLDLNSSAGAPTYLLVEDMGPSGAPL